MAIGSLAELISAYLEHCKDEYKSREAENLASSLKKLAAFAGDQDPATFRSRSLIAYRSALVAGEFSDRELSRPYVNRLVDHVRRLYLWAVAEELVEPEVLESLRAVRGLRRGRTDAPEPDPVRAVDPARIRATMPHLSPPLAAIVELLRLTGARTGELRQLRNRDIDTSREIWLAVPERHKTQDHGHRRIIPLDEEAQAVLLPFYTPLLPDEFVFPSPRTGRAYGETALRNAVRKACERAEVEPWHPHQIRHAVLTELVAASDGELEAAQLIAGHAHRSTTEAYLDRNLDATLRAAEKLRAARPA